MTASSDANPLEALSSAARGAVEAIATALARLPLPRRQPSPSTTAARPAARTAAAAAAATPTFPGARAAAAAAAAGGSHRVSKEELGRATWTLLHSVAAALPSDAQPLPRRQRKAFCQLVHSLAELYPCAECAEHFGRIVDARPPERAAAAGDAAAIRLWLCDAHNDVNEKLGKPRFDCSLVGARWAGMDCDGEDGRSSGCELAGPGRRKA